MNMAIADLPQRETDDLVTIQENTNRQTERALAALAALAESSISELRMLRVDEIGGGLHLSGRVRSFYHKQLAQETIRPVAAGRRVVNSVAVGP